MADVSVKGIRLSDGRKVQLLVADEPKKSDGTDLLATDLGAANGIATLDGSSLVVQEPASTSVGAAADSIVKRDTNADVLVPNVPTSTNAAASKIYVDQQVTLGRAWKELLLVPEQLENGGAGGLNPCFMIAIVVDLAAVDFITITDGSSPETYTAVGAAPAANEFVAGGGIPTTTANLAATINADSSIWGAVVTTGLDTYFSAGSDPQLLIFRLTPSETAVDRCFGTIASAQSDIQTLNFAVGLDYGNTSSIQSDLLTADGTVGFNGIGRLFANLLPGETHKLVDDSSSRTWDSDDEIWQLTGQAAGTIPAKGSAVYAGAAPIYAEADALLPAIGDYGYFFKGATDTVFHFFRRSIAAGTLADFGIVQMT